MNINTMELKEALQILGLNTKFTSEDIKKAHRREIAKYHPDLYENKSSQEKSIAETKAKKINAAKDYLNNYLKNQVTANKRPDDSNFSQEQEKNEKLKHLKVLIKKALVEELKVLVEADQRDTILMNNRLFFIKLINDFDKKMYEIKNERILNKEYKKFTEEYQKCLVKYYFDVWNATHFQFLTKNFDFTTLKKLRSSLEAKFIQELNQELIKYETYEYYEEITAIFLGYRNGYACVCLYGYLKIETAKKEFNKKICQEFKDYKRRKKQLEELKCNKSIPISIIKELEDAIINPTEYEKIYSKIDTKDKIKGKIKKHFK